MSQPPLRPVDLGRRRLPLLAIGLALMLAVPIAAFQSSRAEAQGIDSSAGPLRIDPVATGLTEPWALAFLPEGGFLVTERAGRLLHVGADGTARAVAGVPRVLDAGQGGLLDVLVPRDFAATREVIFTYAAAQPGGSAGTALGVGRLSDDGARLEDVRELFQSAPGFGGGRHFGSRVAEGPDGRLFMTVGDRGSDDSAQDRGNHNGTILRLNRDGSVPADNPFVGQPGMQPEIWSWGHRNPQGLAFDAQGRLWATEHGPRGGDELNLVERGRNHGWPVIGEGVHYSGRAMAGGREAEGMVRPRVHWSPAYAPSGLAAYDGGLFDGWRGSLFAGSLTQDRITRIDPARGYATEILAAPQMGRVRDVRAAPDGSIWFLSVHEGAVFRMAPRGR